MAGPEFFQTQMGRKFFEFDVPKIGKALERIADALEKRGFALPDRIRCSRCGKSVSSPVPRDTVVRAFVECPECVEKGE